MPHSVRPERRFPKQKKPRAKWGAGLRKETVVLPWGATKHSQIPKQGDSGAQFEIQIG